MNWIFTLLQMQGIIYIPSCGGNGGVGKKVFILLVSL